MAFKYDNLLNPLRNVLSMRRVDPITQIVLLLVVLPLTLIAAVFVGIAEGIRLSCLDNKVRKTLPTARQTRADEVKNANAIYYVIRKIEMKKYSLIQYVDFYTQTKDGMRNITNYMLSQYYYIQKYCGRSQALKGTIKLTDYDIVRLSEDLNGRLKETLL